MDVRGVNRIAIWGGIECTVRRIAHEYADQTVDTGHHDRVDDLERVASLGISALRYPLLWERVAPDGVARADWSWTDERLDRLRSLGIEPIATLVHHGSGPRYTDLLDPEFPQKLAEYAQAVARRYPWLRKFTPVNEPLTTARFACMYGWWHPHRTDPASFVRALLNETAATACAMRAIREVIPNAQLVTTEDLGKSFGTPALAEQLRHENARRFLGYDLLCERLGENRAMLEWLERLGFPTDAKSLAPYRCVPDVMGFNYYVTGERWLDERLARYPAWTHGGNGTMAYADVEAVRVCYEGLAGPRGLLGEAWERYGRPIALTEAHLNCTREEQVRWLRDLYLELTGLQEDGADVRALTVWSLFGAQGWDTMCRDRGRYESGAFDVSSGTPRETAVARYVRSLAAGSPAAMPPGTDGSGWWSRDIRYEYPRVSRSQGAEAQRSPSAPPSRRPLIVLDSGEALQRALLAACELRDIPVVVVEQAHLTGFAARNDFWAAVDVAGSLDAWRCQDPREEEARRLRSRFDLVARAAREAKAACAVIGSPLVFAASPFERAETEDPRPTLARGFLYERLERTVREGCERALIVRCGIVFEEPSLAELDMPGHCAAAADDVAHLMLDLLLDGERGVVHANNAGVTGAARVEGWYLRSRAHPRQRSLDEARAHRTALLSSAS